jgi:hypothetical protein
MVILHSHQAVLILQPYYVFPQWAEERAGRHRGRTGVS